ncbi:MAG: fumarylacetoacetate hydrolase family protein [Oscillospiraceae bacterium]|nr:fumarylacetoacetate hydrolase family protein [Oscillospiraceae bacterium]
MKLKQLYQDGKIVLGIVTPEGIVDVADEAAKRGLTAPGTMLEAIQAGQTGMEVLSQLAQGASCFAQDKPAPAVTGCDKILCIGLNYRQHAKECNLPLPPAPVLFNKFSNALAADGEAVYLDPGYVEYDYEAELVAVIGKPARNVSEEDALSYVFGYTCGNDLSTRDLQFARSNQWLLSKTFDGFAPVGPCVVTADAIDPNDLPIRSYVNGEKRQDSRTSDMIFSVAQIIADLSRHFTLLPGDLIFTGTPQGVMHGYPKDQKNWLKPGDRVEIEIEGIGTLKNTFYR